MVEGRNLNFRYGNTAVLKNINFTAQKGEITAVIGANGVGKSTLLKCIAGILKYEGELLYMDSPISSLKAEEHAKKIGYLGQRNGCIADLNVFEVILMGLVNELSFHVSENEIEKVNKIMKLMGIEDYAGRKINNLSGGQQQLVFIAQTLVKGPKILIMDEPTSALDLNKQFALMDLIKRVTKENNLITLVCHHHLDLVSKYADRVIVLKGGELYCESSPQNAFTKEMFKDVYGMEVEFCTDSEGIRHMIPVNRI